MNLEDLHKEFQAHALDDERRFEELRDLIEEKFANLEERLQPMLDSYNGIISVKSIIVGFGTVILSIGAIGAGVIWLFKALKM